MNPVLALLRNRRWPLYLAILGTLVRLALIVWARHHSPFYDEYDYENIGLFLIQGHGFSNAYHDQHTGAMVWYHTAYRAPGQPMLVAALFSFFGHNLFAVKVFEALILAVIPLVCARVGLALGMSTLAANIGATLATFHPAIAFAVTTLYPTALTTAAVTLGVWLCYLAWQKNSTLTAIAAGIVLGIAGAATTTFAPLAFLAAVVLLLRKRLKAAVLVAIFGLTPAAAWMIRNKLVLNDFALATNGGYNLQLGANDRATPRSGNWVELNPDWGKGEVAIDKSEATEAKAWIHAHPARYAELAAERAFVVFDSVGKPKTEGAQSGKLALIIGWALLPIMILAVIGLLLHWRHPLTWFTVAALSLVIVSSALTIAKPRFRLPCDPLLCVFAASVFSRSKEESIS